jgi:hypothetical protein
MRQHFINQKYSVVFDECAEKCYIREFARKHKKNWDVTRQSINDSLERIANLSGTTCLDVICASNKDTCLAKYDFKIAKTNVSAKTSGNRCILEVCNKKMEVRVHLVYSKEHISRSSGQETLWWKEHLNTSCSLSCA